jgi:hypothetical protein
VTTCARRASIAHDTHSGGRRAAGTYRTWPAEPKPKPIYSRTGRERAARQRAAATARRQTSIVNRYAKPCRHCGMMVAVGAGRAWPPTTSTPYWTTSHLTQDECLVHWQRSAEPVTPVGPVVGHWDVPELEPAPLDRPLADFTDRPEAWF